MFHAVSMCFLRLCHVCLLLLTIYNSGRATIRMGGKRQRFTCTSMDWSSKNNSKFTDIDVMSRSENNTKLDIIFFFYLNLTMMKVVNVVFFS